MKVGIDTTPRVSRQRGVRASSEFTTAVELWAREFGGHALLEWAPAPANAWVVKLSLKDNDPRKRAENAEDHYETVVLHDWHEVEWFRKHGKMNKINRNARGGPIPSFYAPTLDEMGVTGIIARLSRQSLLSGRGEHGTKTAEQIQEDRRQQFRADKDKRRRNQRDDAVHEALDKRRSRLKIPFLPVGIEFGSGKSVPADQSKE